MERLATGWTIEGFEFESQCGQIFALPHIVQTDLGVHLTPYPIGTGALSPGV
jgi:hypothetical protein